MTDNKLVELVKNMSGVEKRECTIFLKSPYHNRRDDVRRLWEQCISSKDTFPAATRELNSLLTGCIEAFLAQRAAEQLPLFGDLHLIAVYRAKGLQKPLEHVFRRAAVNLDRTPRDLDYYHHLYQLEYHRYAATESQQRTATNNLGSVIAAFDQYLIAGKLRLACLMLSHKAVFQNDYDDKLLQVIVEHVTPEMMEAAPVIALYYFGYQSLREEKESDFRAFREQIALQSPTLPVDENRIFLLLAINFCIRKLNSGNKNYVREAFDLYRIGIENKALLENGKLSRFAFKNIVSLGLNLEEFEWIRQFIIDYEPFLDEKHRHAHRDYNLAKLHFTQKNYREAMPLLARVDESDLLLNLDSRVMLLKMYYEMEEQDALDALLSSFKILLLRKKKIIGYHQQHYLNTLRFVQKLSRLNFNDRAAVERFRKEVTEQTQLLEKEWLLVQCG